MKTLLKSSTPTVPLLNSVNWDPALHPRDSDGEFQYNGGRHRKTSRLAHSKIGPKITIPPHPSNADVYANMRLMSLTATLNPFGKYPAFYLLVETGGPWDYKNQPSSGANPQYQDFGNFNYGAAGTAAGFDAYTLQNEAGHKQPPGTGGKGVPGKRGNPKSGIPPYGDLPIDNYWIRQGILYAHQHGY